VNVGQGPGVYAPVPEHKLIIVVNDYRLVDGKALASPTRRDLHIAPAFAADLEGDGDGAGHPARTPG
jgi:hypothetical protein